jgi:hypothetical protein
MKTTDTATTTVTADQAATTTQSITPAEPTEDAIRLRAYCLWEAAGHPAGWDDHFWTRAEAELHGKYSEKTQQTSSDS